MYKKFIFFAIFIFITTLTFSFAKNTEETPLWLSDIQAEYPESEYIAKIGYANTLDLAKTNAVGNLATYIKTDVTKNTQASQNFKNINNLTTEQKELSIQTDVISDVSLYGLEFSKAYYNKKERKWYCVAYINREFAWSFLKKTVEQKKEIFMSYVIQANQEIYSINKIFYLQNALDKSNDFLQELLNSSVIYPKATDLYQEQLNVIYNLPANIQNYKDSLTTKIQISQDYLNMISSFLTSKAPDMHIKISNNANYFLDVNLEFNITENELFIVYPFIQINFLSNNNIILYTYTLSLKEKTTAYTLDVAKKKAIQKLLLSLEDEFCKNFNTFFNLED